MFSETPWSTATVFRLGIPRAKALGSVEHATVRALNTRTKETWLHLHPLDLLYLASSFGRC